MKERWKLKTSRVVPVVAADVSQGGRTGVQSKRIHRKSSNTRISGVHNEAGWNKIDCALELRRNSSVRAQRPALLFMCFRCAIKSLCIENDPKSPSSRPNSRLPVAQISTASFPACSESPHFLWNAPRQHCLLPQAFLLKILVLSGLHQAIASGRLAFGLPNRLSVL